jgi:chemotaxis protein histidine kinase CheA
MSNTFDKLSVLDSFIEEVNSYLPEIEANLVRLTQSPGDMEALEETYRRTHTIGGSASMMDFAGLAHVAHGMEDILGDVQDGLSTLDIPTIELLQRSLARLYRLVGGIQHGIDENAVMAEDDEDYTRYRTQQDAAQGVSGGMITPEYVNQTNGSAFTYQNPEPMAISSLDEMLASFRTPSVTNEEVSWPEEPVIRAEFSPRPDVQFPVPPMQPAQPAQFEAPVSPKQPVQPAQFEAPVSPKQPVQPAQFEAPFPPQPSVIPQSPSALEMLAGSNRRQEMSPSFAAPSVIPPTAPPTLLTPHLQTPPERVYPVASSAPVHSPQPPLAPVFPPQPSLAPVSAPQPPLAPVPPPQLIPPQPIAPLVVSVRNSVPEVPIQPPLPVSISPIRQEPLLPTTQSTARGVIPASMPTKPATTIPASSLQAYEKMESETLALVDQAASFKRILAQLRLAASLIEDQRTEFKGFLDGSRDALDRMEEWAGKAMGLNLRNSPEHVRRYLPLSVMWVANSKLKKVLDMLIQMANGAETTEEQMQVLLQQLQDSLTTTYSEIFVQAPQESTPAQEFGWSSWEVQASSDPRTLRERVTFERQGDLAALRSEIEAELREELRAELHAEYESKAPTLADRAEMERHIHEEVRQEFNAQQQSRTYTSNVESAETPEEMEARLRNEIEIQVRSEVLSRIEAGGGGAAIAAQMALLSLPGGSASAAPPAVIAPPVIPSSSQHAQVKADAATMGNDFGEEAAEIFRLEAEEHLQTISMYVAALEHAPTNLEPIQGIRRATHTLKGAAGMMGFRAIADLCHVSEDMLDGVMEGGISISPTVLSLILDTAEALDSLINGKGTSAENENAGQSLRLRYAELLGEQASLASLREEEIEIEEDPEISQAPVTSVVNEANPLEAAMPGTARADLSVRVSLSKLDELVNLFGELLVNRTILEERIQRLTRLVLDTGVSSARLRDVGQRLESRFEAATLPSGRSLQVMPGEGNQNVSRSLGSNDKNGRTEPAHLAEFDELELDRYTEFHQLARGLSEGISDMTTLSTEMETVIRDCEGVFGRESRLSTTFQDRLMKARLVPLSTMIPRLYRTARAVALKQHKEFELVLEGQETEVDRTVIEEIAGPLLHLMRNAVNHALETPEVRQQRGKPSAGQIKLSASYEGNLVVITVRDDGTGIDPERIRNEAIHRGLIRADQAINDNEIVELIFRPGFSTAEVLSEESGRGVGLDVVRDSVSRLRGTLEVESMPGQGTAFTMKFPTSLAIQNAMMVKVADQQFAIPTVMVEAIGRLDNFTRTTYGGRPAVLVQKQPYPLRSLAQLLGLSVTELNEKAPILLVRTDRNRVALVVDDIKGRMDVVIKNLGSHLRNVHGIAGGTVLGNGRVVLILELLELLASRTGVRGAVTIPAASETPEVEPMRPAVQVERRTTIAPSVPTSPKPVPVAPQGKHVLVVDDSPSVRRVVSNMLKQRQWEVQTARDGVEALEMISQETPAAVLLDIEMPRMDGYELMATVRAQEQYRTLPLIVLTSRAAAKHQQRAMQLGASSYVVKPYQDDELINILNALVRGM